jgi:UDP-N-acetylglucosamine diphosphorylase/glucosamine-1-phosphate N-acetyltransferase
MTALYLYDDARARRFEPFALTRPASTLVVGVTSTWERWRSALAMEAAGVIVASHLADFDEPDAPNAVKGEIPAGAVIANSRFAPALSGRGTAESIAERRATASKVTRWRHAESNRTAAVRVARALPVAALSSGDVTLDALDAAEGSPADLDGWWVDEVWDLVRLLPAVLADDLNRLAEADVEWEWEVPRQRIALGEHSIRVATAYNEGKQGAIVEPNVVFDASAGPIRVAAGAHVHAFTRLVGPCYIGPGSTVMGGDISSCSIGPVCKIRGELSNSIFVGYANKGHDGFVGHSVLGRWVNLGASTVTSNLKNTYGTVALWTPDGIRDTRLQFLGTMFGDHAKTGIGLRLTTGTVLGAGANVYGSAMPPKVVPPFAWGERAPYGTYRLDKFLEVAERMMARRHVQLSEQARRQLAASHDARWTVDDGDGNE